MPPTSNDDLVTLAALGDEDAQKKLQEQTAQLSKGTDPAQQPEQQDPNWSVEQLAKAAGANPPAPPVKQTPEQAKADGGQQTPGNPVLSKAEDGDEKREDESDDEYKERMEKKCKKSLDSDDVPSPEEDALLKAMDIAENIARGAQAAPDPDRREVLAKAYADGSLDDDGRVELFELMKSEMPAGENSPDLDNEQETGDQLNKGFTDAALSDPAIEAGHTDEDGVDVSGYLARLSSFVGGALDTINSDLSKSLDRVHQYNLASSKANRALGAIVLRQEKMIKSLSAQNQALGARVEHVEQQPQQRRSVPTAQALQKSLTTPDGQPTSGLTKDQTTKGFGMLMRKSMESGYSGEAYHAPCGRDITTDTAHYESHGQIHPDMLADIKTVLGKN
jgi:hypothetical protein